MKVANCKGKLASQKAVMKEYVLQEYSDGQHASKAQTKKSSCTS